MHWLSSKLEARTRPDGQRGIFARDAIEAGTLLTVWGGPVYHAAYAIYKRHPETSSAVSVAKVYANDAYRECGNRGIQVHGGMGFTWENEIHLYYRRAKASETMLGDNTFHRERLAALVIG